MSQQLEAAKGTATLAEERRLQEMQVAMERAQAELTATDLSIRETLIATLRQSAEASGEALRAQQVSQQEALAVLKQDLNARVSESHRAIEMLTRSQKAQSYAADQRAESQEAMLRQLHGILADLANARPSVGGSGGPPGPPPRLPSSGTEHEYGLDFPRVKQSPGGRLDLERSRCLSGATRQTTTLSRVTTKEVKVPAVLLYPPIPMEEGGGGPDRKGRNGHDPDDPEDPDDEDSDEDDSDGDGSGDAPARRGRSTTMNPPQIKAAESNNVAIFPEPAGRQHFGKR